MAAVLIGSLAMLWGVRDYAQQYIESELTALENVAVVTEIARAPMQPAEALGMVGLADRLDHFPAQLSGGEQQRVAIARALSHKPAVLLADEPTGNLDDSTAESVLALLDRLVRDSGHTMLIATHSQHVASHCDRVLELQNGKLASAA